MAKVLYSATISLDGFMAGPSGDMSWLADYLGPNPVAEGLVDQIGALLVGRRTFEGDDPNRGTEKEGALEGAWQGPQFVLTHAPPPEGPAFPGIRFVSGDVADVVAAAREAAEGRDVVVIGAAVARECLGAGVLDELLVHVAPGLLGAGVRLVETLPAGPVRLERLGTADDGPLATLRFRVVR